MSLQTEYLPSVGNVRPWLGEKEVEAGADVGASKKREGRRQKEEEEEEEEVVFGSLGKEAAEGGGDFLI